MIIAYVYKIQYQQQQIIRIFMQRNLANKILPLSNPFKDSSVSTSQCSSFPNVFQYNDRSKLCFEDDSIQQDNQQYNQPIPNHHKQIDIHKDIQMQVAIEEINSNDIEHMTQTIKIGSKINEKTKFQLSQAQSIVKEQQPQKPRSRKSIIQQLTQITGQQMIDSNVIEKNMKNNRQITQHSKPRRNRIFNHQNKKTTERNPKNIFRNKNTQHMYEHPSRMSTNNKIRPQYRDSGLPQQPSNYKRQLQRQFYQKESVKRPECIHAKCMLKAMEVIDKITNQNIAHSKSREILSTKKQLNSAFYKLFLQVTLKLDKISNMSLDSVFANEIHSIEWLEISCIELKDRLVEQSIDQFKNYSEEIRKISYFVNVLRKIQQDYPKWKKHLDILKQDIEGVFYSGQQIKYKALKRITQTLQFMDKQLLLHQKNKQQQQHLQIENQYLFFLQKQQKQLQQLKEWIQNLVGKQINFSSN